MHILLSEHWQLRELVTGHYQDCCDPSSLASNQNLETEHAPEDRGKFARCAGKEMTTN
jgi:hypothetical protein